MSTLEEAITIAVQAHRGQLYSDNEPYIFHVFRVMMRCQSEDERIVAALHDVVEDGAHLGFDLDYIREQCFDERVLHAVELLTHAPGVPYDQYIRRIALNKLARRVKWADVGENYLHLHNITDIERRARLARKYAMALEILSEAELATN